MCDKEFYKKQGKRNFSPSRGPYSQSELPGAGSVCLRDGRIQIGTCKLVSSCFTEQSFLQYMVHTQRPPPRGLHTRSSSEVTATLSSKEGAGKSVVACDQ